ncbi:MAG TPA: hypothetical protein VHP33_28830 [Polyangiaceae bacterium]|nr:hypothetical protein [Polyangiaceae bacterium]
MQVGRAFQAFRSLAGALFVLPLFAGCAGKAAPSAEFPAAPGSDAPGATGSSEGAARPGAPGTGGRATGAAPAASFPRAPLPGGEEPTPDKALPELRVEQLGMHVGGGKNDADEKAPFRRALEQKFPAFMECYRLVDDPWAGGSFGVDLKIARAGGAPTVEQPRTRIRGAGFQECMVAAFGKVQFEKPRAGPTVISYSILFALGKGKPKG